MTHEIMSLKRNSLNHVKNSVNVKNTVLISFPQIIVVFFFFYFKNNHNYIMCPLKDRTSRTLCSEMLFTGI